jgi:hypothetical protein
MNKYAYPHINMHWHVCVFIDSLNMSSLTHNKTQTNFLLPAQKIQFPLKFLEDPHSIYRFIGSLLSSLDKVNFTC